MNINSSKASFTYKKANFQNNAPGNNEVIGDTKTYKMDLQGMFDKYKQTAKENAEKVRALTEELRNLKLSSNPTQEEIDDFKTKAISLRNQVNALYDELDSLNVRTKSTEVDEFVHAVTDFNSLLNEKLDEANNTKPNNTNSRHTGTTMSSLDVVKTLEDAATQETVANENPDTKTHKMDLQGMFDEYKQTAKENAEKVRALTEELRNLKLSSNPTQEEIDDFKTKAISLRNQVNALYDELDSFNVRTKSTEVDEFVYAVTDFYKLLNIKLDIVNKAK